MKDEIRCSIEVREDEARLGPGRLVGTIMRYGERAADRPELFRGWLSDVVGQGGDIVKCCGRGGSGGALFDQFSILEFLSF